MHFPDGRDVVIDSKVSLTAWDRYVNSADEVEKKEALSDHRVSIKNHFVDNFSVLAHTQLSIN